MDPTAARAGATAAELGRMLATLFWVVAITAIVLAGLGAVPRWLGGEELRARRAATLAEAERRLGGALYLPAYFPARLVWPPTEIRIAGGRGGSARVALSARGEGGHDLVLLQSLTPGVPVAPELLGGPRVLATSPTTLGGHPARMSTVLVGGLAWSELSWVEEGREIRLRTRGELDELYRMAHSARREGR